MAQEQVSSSWLHGLTKPKGMLVAAPLIVGAGLLVNAMAVGDSSAARDQASKAVKAPQGLAASNSTAQKAPDQGGKLLNEATNPATKGQVQLAAAERPANGAGFSAAQRNEIGKIVREYLLKNPKVLEEVSEELTRIREEEKKGMQAKVLVDEKQSIFYSPHDFVLGNPKGDVTVVEYFDYNCGWCKRALNEVRQITASDKNVRVVMKEFPIFGEDSQFAAKAALASIKQNKYWEFHVALMKAKRVTVKNTLEIAKSVGIDVEALKAEMAKPVYDKTLAENSRVAQALGMQGTPGFIVDSQVSYGYVPAVGLQSMLADVRKNGCKIC
jgi:protein-disulfide isomerase